MERLPEVAEAMQLMSVAKDWSIWKWLTEKKRVRAVADRGTAALNEAERQVKSTWDEDLRNAYAVLSPPEADADDPYAASEYEFAKLQAEGIDERIKAIARRVKEADQRTYETRMTAERTFEDAEKKLSPSLSRLGAEQALVAYEAHERAIAEAEAARDGR